MESSLGPHERVRGMERAEAAPYVGMPPSPWWVPPTLGLWFAAYVGAFTFWRENEFAFLAAMVALCAGIGVFLGWLTRRYGALAMPGRGTPPPEIRREYRHYAVSAAVIVGIVAGTWWWAGIVTASVVTFVLTTTGLARYQARYERAASLVRERLA